MNKNTKSGRKLEGSLKRKYDYNRKMKDDFGIGYTAGVELYNMYPNETKEGQKKIRDGINATWGFARENATFEQGIMCGFRDASVDRKLRYKSAKKK